MASFPALIAGEMNLHRNVSFYIATKGKSYAYDSNGNGTSVTVGTSVTSLTYDYENRVTGITYPSSATNSFTYNGNDLRMQKVDSAGTANYVCDGTTPASAVLKDGSAVYTPGRSERRGSTSKFYHGDALGSTRGITNSSQTVTDSLLYDAFGMTVSRTGITPMPFGFVGKGQYQTDSDSGLMLLGHRYYDASIGRFISSDPAKAGNNWYAYCGNNPLRSIDPTGLILLQVGFSYALVFGGKASWGDVGLSWEVGKPRIAVGYHGGAGFGFGFGYTLSPYGGVARGTVSSGEDDGYGFGGFADKGEGVSFGGSVNRQFQNPGISGWITKFLTTALHIGPSLGSGAGVYAGPQWGETWAFGPTDPPAGNPEDASSAPISQPAIPVPAPPVSVPPSLPLPGRRPSGPSGTLGWIGLDPNVPIPQGTEDP